MGNYAGLTLTGRDGFDNLGRAVVDLGDINGDGLADFAVSAPSEFLFDEASNYGQSGAVYVVFGDGDGALPAMLDVADIDGANGFRVAFGRDSREGYAFGRLIAGGDVNGDGLGDLVVSTASYYSFYGDARSTEIFVLFGRDVDSGAQGFGTSVDVGALDGSDGLRLTGVDGDVTALSADADVNGDGVADIVIGQQPGGFYGGYYGGYYGGFYGEFGVAAFDAPPVGPTLDTDQAFLGYVVFGAEDLGAGDGAMSVAELNGRNGFGVLGARSEFGGFYGEGGAYSESLLIPVGDVNGDGFTDLLAVSSTVRYDDYANGPYYYGGYGPDGEYDPTLDGPFYSPGRTIEERAFIIFGRAVGDVEGGEDFPAEVADPGFFPSTPDGVSINIDWFPLTEFGSVYDATPSAVAGVGDVNGDGFDDVAFSFPYLSGRGSGETYQDYGRSGVVYVLFGGPDGVDDGDPDNGGGLPQFFSSFLFDVEGKPDGFALFDDQEEIFQNVGVSVSAAGDIDGDGVDDFLVGVARADSNPGDDISNPGAVLLVLGRDAGDPFPTFFDVRGAGDGVYRLEGFEDFQQIGGALYDGVLQTLSPAGDVNGDGVDDLIIGAPYSDGDSSGRNAGQAFVLFGGREALEAADAADGANDNVIRLDNIGVDVETGALPIEVSLRNAGFVVTSVTEGDPDEAGTPRELVFVVQRTGDLTADVTVDFAVGPRAGISDGFNVDAADFVGGAFPSGTARFAAGSATAEIRVAVNPDTTVENNEQLQITLSNPVTDSGDSIFVAPGRDVAFGSISNDDFPVRFSASAASALEGDTPADAGVLRFTVSRSGETGVRATVDAALSGGTFSDAAEPGLADVGEIRIDGAVVGAGLPAGAFTLVFEPGETAKLIEVVATPDQLIEGSERVRLTLTDAAADGAPVEIRTTVRDAFILNDDEPVTLSVFGANADEDSGQALAFEIRRSGDIDSPVTVTYSVGASGANAASEDDVAGIEDENGSQAGGFATRTVTFQPGETVKRVTVQLAPDAVEEATERVRLTIDAADSDAAQGVVGVGRAGDAFIVNDDFPPQVTLSPIRDSFTSTFTPSVIEGDPSNRDGTPRPPNTVSLFVNRRGDHDGEVVVSFELRQQTDFGAFRSADGLDLFEVRGADGAFDPIQSLPYRGAVTIPDGETSAEIVIAINPDLAPEPNEFFEAVVTGVRAVDFTQYGVVNRDLDVQIRNDDGLPPNFRDGVPFDDDGDPSTPPVIINVEADIFGDPHIVTLDGLGYSFQAVGDYILVESVDQTGADAFQVQVRFEPLPGSDLVSVTTRMAVEIGGVLVEFDARAANPLLLDGATSDHDFAAGPLDLDGDGLGDVFFDDASGMFILVLLRDGDGVPVRGLEVKAESGFGGFLNVCTFLAPDDRGNVRGLLGDANADLANDFQLRSGEALPAGAVDDSSGVPSPTFEFLYGAYRDSWRLTGAAGEDNASRFTAGSDPFDPTFPAAAIDIDDLPPELLAAGQLAAAGIADPILRDNAILDFALTGDPAFIAGAAGVAADPDQKTDPSGAPEVANFVTIAADAAAVAEGDAGVRSVTFTVFREAADDDALAASFAVDVALGGDLDATDGVALSTAQVTFEGGQTEATVTVTFDGDTANEDDETIVVTISSADPSVVVAGSMAMTTVQTDDTPPELVDDAFDVAADAALTGDLTAPNPTQADGDAQGDAITVIRIVDSDGVSRAVDGGTVTLPSGARLTIAADGSFTFNPFGFFVSFGNDDLTDWDRLDAGEIGLETFSYVAVDGNGGESAARVEISIVGIDDAPVTVIDEVQVSENGPEVGANVIAGTIAPDFDPEGGPLTVVAIIDDGARVAIPTDGLTRDLSGGGRLSIGRDGAFTFDPDGDFEDLGDQPGQLAARLESVGYVVSDANGNETTETLRFDVRGVNDAPEAADDDAGTDFQTAVTIDVLSNDDDAEGDGLTVVEVFTDEAIFGTVEINDDGTLTYTPDDGFAGVARFGYAVSDGDASDVAEVSVTVDGPGARTFTVDSLTIVEGDDGTTTGELTVRRTGDLRVVDTISGTTRSGTATEFVDFVGVDVSGTFGPGVGVATATLRVNGDVDIEGFERFFVDFSIDSAFDNFTVEADAAPTGSAFAFTAPVGIADDDSTLEIDSPQASEDAGSVTFTITRRGVLPEADFGVRLVEGTATSPEDFLGDGLFLPIQFAEGQAQTTFTVGLVDDRVEEDDETFLLQLLDDAGVAAEGTATILNDDAPNTPPSAIDEAVEVGEDDGADVVVNVLANDGDADDISVVRAFDSAGAEIAIGVATDLPEGGVITIDADGEVIFDPAGDFEALGFNPQPEPPARSLAVRYVVSDGEDEAEATLTIGVRGVNDAPVAVADGPFAAREGATTGPLDVLANDRDAEGDPLAIVGGDAFTLLGGRVVLAEDGASLSVDYSAVDLADLAEGETRADSFAYVVSDGDKSSSATVSLTLEGKPDDAAFNEIVGTEDSDRLTGTDAADLIRSLGGRQDVVTGGGGLDVFDFSDSTANGMRETRAITDYEAGEAIDIGEAAVLNFREIGGRVIVYLDGDRDVIVVNGVGDFDELTFI